MSSAVAQQPAACFAHSYGKLNLLLFINMETNLDDWLLILSRQRNSCEPKLIKVTSTQHQKQEIIPQYKIIVGPECHWNENINKKKTHSDSIPKHNNFTYHYYILPVHVLVYILQYDRESSSQTYHLELICTYIGSLPIYRIVNSTNCMSIMSMTVKLPAFNSAIKRFVGRKLGRVNNCIISTIT